MINILRQMKKFLADLMARLSDNIIHKSLGCSWITTTKVMNPFFLLMNPSFFSIVSFQEKIGYIYLITYLLIITKSLSLDTSAKTTSRKTSNC